MDMGQIDCLIIKSASLAKSGERCSMITVTELASQMVEIYVKGDLTSTLWQDYLRVVLSLLNTSQHKLYILSNFTDVKSFDSQFTRIDTTENLTHPQLGLNVILCLSSVIVFQLQLCLKHAQQAQQSLSFRVCRDFDWALEMLKRARESELQLQFA